MVPIIGGRATIDLTETRGGLLRYGAGLHLEI